MYNFGAHIKMMARTIYNYSENGFFAHYFLKINNALSFDKFKKVLAKSKIFWSGSNNFYWTKNDFSVLNFAF